MSPEIAREIGARVPYQKFGSLLIGRQKQSELTT